MDGIPRSLLDTDLYKFTMQQAVLRHFPYAQATYQFTHRDKDVFFSKECIESFQAKLPYYARVKVEDSEIDWLKRTCPFLKDRYIDYLSAFRFKPEQVSVKFLPSAENPEKGQVDISARGPWVETILWEVPLMACLSETYFHIVDQDWSNEGQEEIAYNKGKALLSAGVQFSEFGTRRRRSYYIQDLVVKAMIRAASDHPSEGKFIGTSNVHLAHKHDVAPIGTIAHEWFMGVATLKGYEHVNGLALDLWEQVYPNGPLLALTDTFSTEVFFKDFTADVERARRWKGLRQDSGDPFVYAPRAREIYESMGIDHREKVIIYSDALNLEKTLGLKKQCDEVGFIPSFGVGTFLTNDFLSISSGGTQKSRALNMVIKLANMEGKPCVKISDELMKNTGDPITVQIIKKLYGLPT